MCVTKKRVTKLCVCDREAEREEEEEKRRRRSRIQNQEQEPHTKMWGKNTILSVKLQSGMKKCQYG